MKPRHFLQSFPVLLVLTWLSALPQSGAAHAAEITVGAVLAIAKDEAEQATDETSRIELRAQVARAIRRTAHEAAFGDYVVAALAAKEALFASAARPKDDIDEHNLRIMQEARHAFLAGDVEGAKRLHGECKMKWPPPSCSTGESFLDYNVFLDLQFLAWEFEAGRYDAALQRLKSVAWPADVWQMTLLLGGHDLAAGDLRRIQEIRSLIRRSGLSITACIVDTTSIFVPETVRGTVTKPRPLGEIAALRKLACEGRAEAALETARSFKTVRQRVNALVAISDGLAGIPGLPGE